MELERLFNYRNEAMLYGLALVFLLAGLTKFAYPGRWAAFEPRWIHDLVFFMTPTQMMYASGALETAAGLALAYQYRVKEVASLLVLWLLGITAITYLNGMWTIAIRDIGLVFLAYAVAAQWSTV